jgi:hypothetical protein
MPKSTFIRDKFAQVRSASRFMLAIPELGRRIDTRIASVPTLNYWCWCAAHGLPLHDAEPTTSVGIAQWAVVFLLIAAGLAIPCLSTTG